MMLTLNLTGVSGSKSDAAGANAGDDALQLQHSPEHKVSFFGCWTTTVSRAM